MRDSFITQCVFVIILAAVSGLMFNLIAPQGIGLEPAELKRPLWRKIDLATAFELYSQGAMFFDARDSGDYKLGHVRQAINLPPEEWARMWPMFQKIAFKAKAVVVYGSYYSRRPSAIVAQRLRRSGLETVYVLQAGLDEWIEAGHPVRQPRRGKSS